MRRINYIYAIKFHMVVRILKIIFLISIAFLLIIQFFTVDWQKESDPKLHIYEEFETNNQVRAILDKACNDCHSNSVNVMWYQDIQPIAWWIEDHVRHGREELNFSEFLSYSKKKQDHKLEEVIEEIEKGKMPLESYLYVHGEAELTSDEIAELEIWVENCRKQIQASL